MYRHLFSFLALAAACVLASSHVHTRDHKSLAQRARGDLQLGPIDIKLFSGSRWSWYAAGLGACGRTNTKHDSIVALNIAQFGAGYPGPHCFKTIIMNYNGKSKEAVVTDMCPGCPYGGLDLTESLFEFFDDLGKGIIHGEWHFKPDHDEGQDEYEPSPEHYTVPPRKTTTSKSKTVHVRTSTHLESLSGSQWRTSVASSPPSSNSTIAGSATATSSVAYQSPLLAVPTAPVHPGKPDMINALTQAFLGMASLQIAIWAD